ELSLGPSNANRRISVPLDGAELSLTLVAATESAPRSKSSRALLVRVAAFGGLAAATALIVGALQRRAPPPLSHAATSTLAEPTSAPLPEPVTPPPEEPKPVVIVPVDPSAQAASSSSPVTSHHESRPARLQGVPRAGQSASVIPSTMPVVP